MGGWADAERVVRKEQQIMSDEEFPEDYLLTVYPFTRDVYFSVSSALLDLSAFGADQASLIRSLRSAHRSLRFQPSFQQRNATIQGPFAAVAALREDLIRRARRLQSAQTAAVRRRETPLNPRVISHHESVGSVSRNASKAKLAPESSNGLSAPPQTTGEGAKVQSLLSNAKTQNASSRKNFSAPSWDAGSFCDTDGDERGRQRARSSLKMHPEYRAEGAKANPTQVSREEISAGSRSSLSGLLPAQEISAKHRAASRGENDLGSRYSSTDLSARPKDTRAARPEDPEETCIWVDPYIVKYIEKFAKNEFDRLLRRLNGFVEYDKGVDLMRISLPERTSETASMIQWDRDRLKDLVGYWMSTLRVHRIDYDGQLERQRVMKICDSVNVLYRNVLYILEDSCVIVIGLSASSFLFCEELRDKLKDSVVRPRN